MSILFARSFLSKVSVIVINLIITVKWCTDLIVTIIIQVCFELAKNGSNNKWISKFFIWNTILIVFLIIVIIHTPFVTFDNLDTIIKLHIRTTNLFHAMFYKRSSQLNNNVSSIFFIVRLSNSPIIAKK